MSLSGDTMTGQLDGTTIRVNLGSASSPSFGIRGDANTGMFSPGADVLAFSTAGVERGRFTADGRFGINGNETNSLIYANSTSSGVSKFRFEYDVNDGEGPQFWTFKGRGGAQVQNGDTVSVFENFARTNAASWQQVAEINTIARCNITSSCRDTEMNFLTGSGSSTVERLRITSDGRTTVLSTTASSSTSTGSLTTAGGLGVAGAINAGGTITGPTASVTSSLQVPSVTASRALVTDGASSVAASSTTAAELAFLSGATASVQTQLNAKLATATAATTYVAKSGDTMTGTLSGPTMSITGTGVALALTAGQIQLPAGSTGSPSLFFNVSNTPGIFAGSSGTLAISIGGSNRTVISTGGSFNFTTGVSSTGTPVLCLAGCGTGDSSGITRINSSGDLGIVSGGAIRVRINTTGLVQVNNVTASRAVASDANSALVAATTSATELDHLVGVTANVQTQLNAKVIGGATTAVNASSLTLTNGPTGISGNPNTYINVLLSGVTYVVPAWVKP